VISRFLRARVVEVAGPRPVTKLRPGETGVITSILQTVPERLVKLSSLGVMPGVEVTLVQRNPAVVLKIGETSMALDVEVANAILVESTAAAIIEMRRAQQDKRNEERS
jgi:Fe2+ transport system protein FeoA